MSARSHFRRIFAFIQSVGPADPAHALLLLGATFLFIAHELRWWPASATDSRWWQHLDSPRAAYGSWLGTVEVMTLPILVAGAAAAFLCLVPTRKPLRDLVSFVLLPAFVGLVAIPIIGFYFFQNVLELDERGLFHSVIESSSGYGQTISLLLTNLGPGLQVATAGFVLVAIFAMLVLFGRTSLPIRLRFSAAGSATEISPEEDRRTATFIWMMVCLVPLANLAGGTVLPFAYFLLSPFGSSLLLVNWTVMICSTLFLFALLLIALGKARIATVKQSLRLGSPWYLGIGVLIPAALACTWPFMKYCVALNHWGLYDVGKFMRPTPGHYFPVENLLFYPLYWALVPAFVEEIAWRGYLQPRLVRRYGLVRGIFFVGIVWGAFHFAGDFRVSMSAGAAVLQIARRLTEMVAISYVLGWLTIRSRSILPAALAHGVFNMSLDAGFFMGLVASRVWVIALAWAIVGYLLFRYFPPNATSEEGTVVPAPNLEAAT